MSISYDPFSSGFQSDPYPTLARLRSEDPVHETSVNGTRLWMLTRHEDCTNVLKDSRFSAAKFDEGFLETMLAGDDGPLRALAEAVQSMMLLKDAPDHTRLRTLVNKAFTPRMVERLRPRIEEVARQLIEEMQGRGRANLIADFATPLPIVVIAELLGVPVEDRDRLKLWSDRLATFLDGTIRDAGLAASAQACMELREYMDEIVAARRAEPREDLISGMIAAQERDDRLSDQELFSTVTLLLAAGHETTTNLIGNGMFALMTHRDQFERLRAKPELTRSAVEELLRFDSPVQLTSRCPLEDVVIGGKHIPAGGEVNTSIAGANRDPEIFTEPDRLDITRGENHHLSFGLGAHFCMGSALARLEGQIAFGALVKHLPAMELDGSAPRKPGIVLRGFEAMPVTF